SGPDNGAVAV
nr:Chain C, Epitope from Neuraminidase Protein (NA-181-190) [Influenza A virus]